MERLARSPNVFAGDGHVAVHRQVAGAVAGREHPTFVHHQRADGARPAKRRAIIHLRKLARGNVAIHHQLAVIDDGVAGIGVVAGDLHVARAVLDERAVPIDGTGDFHHPIADIAERGVSLIEGDLVVEGVDVPVVSGG